MNRFNRYTYIPKYLKRPNPGNSMVALNTSGILWFSRNTSKFPKLGNFWAKNYTFAGNVSKTQYCTTMICMVGELHFGCKQFCHGLFLPFLIHAQIIPKPKSIFGKTVALTTSRDVLYCCHTELATG